MGEKAKSIAKNLIVELRAINPNKLYSLISYYDYISFDIFDTLIRREVKNPSDIFDKVEEIYNKSHPAINRFKSERLKAESKARKIAANEEITLQEIYAQLNYPDSIMKELMALEQKIEIESCFPNLTMQKIYLHCLKKHKKIFLTSDMYLDPKTIRIILKKTGYLHFYKLYLSSEKKRTKRSGTLYRLILRENNISTGQLIHIGDNPISDYIIAKKYHIKSILIK